MPFGMNAQAVLTPGGLAEQFGGLMGILATAPNERRKIENESADSDRRYQLQRDALNMQMQDRAARNEYRDMLGGVQKDRLALDQEKAHWSQAKDPNKALFNKIPRTKKITKLVGKDDNGFPIYQTEEVPLTQEEMKQFFDNEMSYMKLLKGHQELQAPPEGSQTTVESTDFPSADVNRAAASVPDTSGYDSLLGIPDSGTGPAPVNANGFHDLVDPSVAPAPMPMPHPIMAHPAMQADPQSSALSRLPAGDQQRFAQILASGNPTAIAEARRRLAALAGR